MSEYQVDLSEFSAKVVEVIMQMLPPDLPTVIDPADQGWMMGRAPLTLRWLGKGGVKHAKKTVDEWWDKDGARIRFWPSSRKDNPRFQRGQIFWKAEVAADGVTLTLSARWSVMITGGSPSPILCQVELTLPERIVQSDPCVPPRTLFPGNIGTRLWAFRSEVLNLLREEIARIEAL
ncbi:MAG: hypothetical protein HYV34_01530 [Candidatus Kerfeldbacteria bacterium]|nr:hypothetical protein [Candidatus Kerfeldbacteria bacterium]